MSSVATSEKQTENEGGNISVFSRITMKERMLVFAIFIVLIIIFSIFITREVYVSIKSRELEAENLSIFVGGEIEREFMHTFTLNEIMKALLFTEDEPSMDFQFLAKHLLPDYPAAKCVQLAPDGIVSQVYPVEGNEAILGHNLFMDPNRGKEVLSSRNIAVLTIGGPYLFPDGKEGFVGRLPVFLDAEKSNFWGFINVVVLVSDILDLGGFSILAKHGYQYSLYKIDSSTGEKVLIKGVPYDSLHKPISRAVSIPNAEWEIALAPPDMWMDLRMCVVLVVMSFLLILAFVFLSILIIQQYVSNKKLAQLAIIDQLTGLFSRQQAIHTLEVEIQNAGNTGHRTKVCFIDMNNFKDINDTYGHTVGDTALRWVAGKLKELVGPNDVVARFGGDEFIIVFRGNDDGDDVSLADSIKKALNAPAELCNGIVADISAAVGFAVFPENGKSVEELIQYSDKAMYKEKARMKGSSR